MSPSPECVPLSEETLKAFPSRYETAPSEEVEAFFSSQPFVDFLVGMVDLVMYSVFSTYPNSTDDHLAIASQFQIELVLFQALAAKVDVSQFESSSSKMLDVLLCACLVFPAALAIAGQVWASFMALFDCWQQHNERR